MRDLFFHVGSKIEFYMMDVYKLSRNFWDWSFNNPEKISPYHVSVFFFAIEHCNRLGWKEKFGFPTSMVLEATGIKSYKKYKEVFDDLCEFGFITAISVSKNQYSSNIISINALVSHTKAHTKALDKALIKHVSKQSEIIDQSNTSIDIQYTSIQDTNLQEGKKVEKKENNIDERKLKFASTLKPFLETYGKGMIIDFYQYWTESNKSNTKFRQELEKTWDLKRRLAKWLENDSKFNKGKKPNVEKWSNPSEVYLCTDWIKRIPQPPNPLDQEACEKFILNWRIGELRTYQHQKTGYTNIIHDYEP
jgi:hypothetical protein